MKVKAPLLVFRFESQSPCFALFLGSGYALLSMRSIEMPRKLERIGLLASDFGISKALMERADWIEIPDIDTGDLTNVLDDCRTVTVIQYTKRCVPLLHRNIQGISETASCAGIDFLEINNATSYRSLNQLIRFQPLFCLEENSYFSK